MWRTYVALFVVVAVVFGGIFCLNYTDNLCNQIESHLIQTLNNIQVVKQDTGEDMLKAYEIWEKNADRLCMIITHDRVEGISVSFQRAFAFFEMGEFAEYNAEVREILTFLQYIRLFDRPTPANIF